MQSMMYCFPFLRISSSSCEISLVSPNAPHREISRPKSSQSFLNSTQSTVSTLSIPISITSNPNVFTFLTTSNVLLLNGDTHIPVSYTHLRAHETDSYL